MKGSAAERARRKAARQDARIRQLEAENAALKARLEQLERLVAKLRKDSSTSSKPPSSDIVKRPPTRVEAQNIAARFREHGKAYFEFITTPGIAPTNNLAEQAIRFVVIDRKITQGTRGLTGRQWCERIWTTIATCTQQNRPVFGFIHDAISAFLNGRPAPSFLPDTS